ncbi:MAG: T9SS type A sorting domain-containing protein, partial [Rhodothermales bacterium]
DPSTAVGTVVGTTTYGYAGLAFDPTDGTLFASAGALDDGGLIATIDKNTGAATPLGYTGYSSSTTDLAFDASGNLFGLVGGGGDPQNLLVAINKSTGVATEVSAVQEASANITHLSGFTCYNVDDGGGGGPQMVYVDIKPGACPNQLNSNANGVVNVAILGTADFDVADIDVSSLTVAGQSPIQARYSDVSQPPADEGPCACTTDGADGYVDLQLKFKNQDLLATLGDLEDGDEFTLTMEGALNDETDIAGEDCIVIKVPGKKSGKGAEDVATPASFALEQNYPNPFNPTTSIAFSLPAETFVDLAVYNTMGQRVATLVSSTLPAGRHTVQWSATDDLGRQLSSGLYIYRIAAGEFVQTQKMLLLE